MRNLDKFGSLVDLKAVLVVQVHLSLAQTTTISLKSLKGMSLTWFLKLNIPNQNHNFFFPAQFFSFILIFHLYDHLFQNSIGCPLKVHNRLEYLQQFILSLSKVGSSRSKIFWFLFQNNLFDGFNKVKGVENVLVVFSHDVWDELINEAVRWYLPSDMISLMMSNSK